MSNFSLIGISGSLSKKSKTEIAINTALSFAEREFGIETEIFPLSRFDLPFCDGRNPDDYTGDARTIIDKIITADAIIFGSPIYRGTFSGAFKNLLDLIPNTSLKGKATAIIATGGSDHHFLSIEHQFKPLLGYFNAYVVPAGVYLNNSHFQDGEVTDEGILDRLRKLSSEIYRLGTLLQEDYRGPERPAIERKSLEQT